MNNTLQYCRTYNNNSTEITVLKRNKKRAVRCWSEQKDICSKKGRSCFKWDVS